MELTSLLKLVVGKLDKLKIPYVLTGGLAVSFWGAPRTTHDIDIIIEINRAQIDRVVSVFQKGFYIMSEDIKGMIDKGLSFNLIHYKTGLKIDFWSVDKTDPHKAIEFKNALKKKIFGKQISIISPEDLVIVKLQWYKMSGLSRDMEDIKSILRISSPDVKYIKDWAQQHSTLSLFESILKGIKGV